jgi:hypothetical protein
MPWIPTSKALELITNIREAYMAVVLVKQRSKRYFRGEASLSKWRDHCLKMGEGSEKSVRLKATTMAPGAPE